MKICLRAGLVLVLCMLGVLSMVMMAGMVYASAGMPGDPPSPSNGASYILPVRGQPMHALPDPASQSNGAPDTTSSTNGAPGTVNATNGAPAANSMTNGR